MMLILLRTSGFLVSARNVLLGFDCFQSSHCMLINTAYRRLFKEFPEDIRKPKYTKRTTIFSLQ